MSVRPNVVNIPSGYFYFAGSTGHAIDNLVIHDYIVPHPPDPTEPTTTTTGFDLTSMMFAISSIELVVIVLLVGLYIKKR
jgi:hypothetical protein